MQPEPTFFDGVAALFRRSLTMAWAFLVGLAGGALALLPFAGDLFEAPGVKEAVQSFLHPDYVPYYIVAISLITALARLRTLNKPG
jgi:hypothetical protein